MELTFELKIVIVAALLGSFLLLMILRFKQKIASIILCFLSVIFLLGTGFYFYTEFTSYQKRLPKAPLSQDVNTTDDVNTNKEEIPIATTIIEDNKGLKSLLFFMSYRNDLNGYEHFLYNLLEGDLEVGVSYLHTLQYEVQEALRKKEYSEAYWNTVLPVAFKYNAETQEYGRLNYDLMYLIPSPNDNVIENDYGDLSKAENYNYFEKEMQEVYIYDKIKTFDRSSANLRAFWMSNKAFVYTFLTSKKYNILCKKVVDDLITVHDTIVATPNYRYFYKRHNISDTIFLSYPSKQFTHSYSYSWPFSFWDRRFAEQNDAVVYDILKEIQNHYND